MNSYERACNSSSFLDTSEFLTISLHLLGCIATPIHLYGAYCILFQTPPTMKSVKFALLNFHFWACFLDFGLSILSTPYVFLPALAGYPLGLLNYFELGPAEQAYGMLTLAAVMTVSIVRIFENRFSIIREQTDCWRHSKNCLLVFNYLLTIICFLPSYYHVPDQKMAFEFLRKFTFCIPPYVDEKRIFIMTIYSRWVLWPGTVCFAIWFIQIFAFSISTSRMLSRQLKRKNFSDKTMEMQKKFQRALVLQVALPVIIFFIPISYIAISSGLWYHNQAINNFCFIILASHGLSSTVAIICLHTAYREFTLGFFCFRVTSYKSDGVSVHGMRNSYIT